MDQQPTTGLSIDESRPAPAEAPAHHAIEQHGVDTSPEMERSARPRDVGGIL